MYRRQAQPAKVTPFQFLDGLEMLIHSFKQQLDLSGMFLDHLSHRRIVSSHDLGASEDGVLIRPDLSRAIDSGHAERSEHVTIRLVLAHARMGQQRLYAAGGCGM